MRILASLMLTALGAAAADPALATGALSGDLRELADRGVLSAEEAGLLERVGEPAAVADALDGVVAARMRARSYTADTREIAEHAVLLRSRLLGGRHPSLLAPLWTLGYLYHVPMELEAALDTYRWALDLSLESFGERSAEAARSLAGLGSVEVDLGDLGGGERHLRRSVEIVEELHGADHPRTGSSLLRLAKVLLDRERYEEARAIWERTRELYEALAAADPGETRRSHALQAARSIHNLGQVHHRLGEIPEAFEDLQEALRRRQDEASKQAASSAAALAELWHDAGDFSRAEEAYRQALEGIERWFGRDAERYAGTMSNLGLLLEQRGDWEAALEWQRGALSLRLEALGTEDSPLVGGSRSRLGALLLRMGDDRAAETELRRALEIQQSHLAPAADLAETLTGLARVELLRGRPGAARELLVDAVAILRNVSPDHPGQILPAGILAGLETDAERVDRDLETVERLYGPASARAVKLLYEKARLGIRSGDLEAALDTALAAEELRREHVRATIHSFPERQALAFLETRDPTLDLALAILARGMAGADPDDVERVWNAVIRSRGLVLDAVISRHRLVRARRDPELELLAVELAAARERLAGLYMRGGAVRPDRKTALVRDAARRVEQAEQNLASASEPFLRDLETRSASLETVTRHLAGDETLVGIVRFVEPAVETGPAVAAATRYLAFIALGGEARARVVPLGEGEDIDELIDRWRRLGDRGLGGARESEMGLRRVGRQLRAAVWDPIARQIGKPRRVFLVPDGRLSLINFASLPAPEGRYLVEEGPIFHLLTTERDLEDLAREPPARGRGLLALGGVDFDRPSGTDPGPDPATAETEAALTRGWSDCRQFAAHRYSPLPETAREVEEIAEVWERFAGRGESAPKSPERQRRLTGGQASEASFKRLAPGRRVLHLATHGFSLDARCSEELGGDPQGSVPRGAARPPGLSSDEGLSAMAGLVLAGANRRQQATAGGDGMLTASEISSLDLTGVEWAVLSACNTGVGEVLSGEGTFGLRRAFAVAGARTVIMSLWRVDDDSTRKLMSQLYELRHGRGLGTAEALHQASAALLRERRAASISTHPVFWGAFVASGDWR